MACYLCNRSNLLPRKGIVRDCPSIRILECADCGLVALESSAHICAGHYESSGMHGEAPPPMESWLREVAEDDQRRFDMLRALMTNRSVLDFGCGAGGFLLRARDVARVVAGIEPERRVHEYWGDGLHLLAGLEDVDGVFDVITAFHVVEHLLDPRAVLRDLSAHLAGGGRLVIEVPSAADALLTLYDCDAFQRFTYWSQHLFLFNAETLRQLAMQAGLRVVVIEQYQRYPLANHLYWLSRQQPGGHRHWSFLDSPALTAAYTAALASVGKCDTLVAHLERA